jgi:hypothetical protein
MVAPFPPGRTGQSAVGGERGGDVSRRAQTESVASWRLDGLNCSSRAGLPTRASGHTAPLAALLLCRP